jgi:Secretion system C-terminal sorting domain
LIKTITVGGTTDTLYNPNVGLRRDHQGNILIASATVLYRVNYKTGAGMNRVQPNPAKTIIAPGVAKNTGDIYTGAVIPPDAIRIYDKDFNLISNAIDTSVGFSRTLEVAADGNTIYWAGFTNGALYKYARATEFDPFPVKPDTILKGFTCESAAWHPKTGYLWLSAGSFQNPANAFPGTKTSWSNNTWYAYNTANGQIVDSLKWVFTTPNGPNERPRAIDFSVGGDTAYVGCFGGSDYAAVQMFVRNPTKVEERNPVVVEGYSLSQNYPNPFNPTTEIRFSIAKAGLTTVKVYNVIGAEVATLVNEYLPAGDHKVTFDAARLPSGTYIYEMRSNSVRLTKKMTVMK